MIEITNVRFTPSFSHERRAGLLGFVSCVLNRKLVLDGIAVRRRFLGTRYLSFPTHTDHGGARHFILRPIDQQARDEIEAAILAALPAETLA